MWENLNFCKKHIDHAIFHFSSKRTDKIEPIWTEIYEWGEDVFSRL